LLSSLYLLYGLSDLLFLIRFGIVTGLPAEGHSARIAGMRQCAMGAFPPSRDFVKSGFAEIMAPATAYASYQQKEHYSGKKKTHTDKNLLLVNEHTSKVIYLGPTVAGKMHDKKAADTAQIAYPVNATLDKDTGFQGYEPAGVLTQQPKKSPQARS